MANITNTSDATAEDSAEFAVLPKQAHTRMAEMRGTKGHRGLATSDLSTNEFLLVLEAGFEPVGLVVGSSIYHIGFQQTRWNANQEMTVLTQAMYHARDLAMNRMEEEAHELGADGVVGVHLYVDHKEWGKHIAEFVAIGTAIVHRDDPHRFKNKHGRPFTSDMSGQDFYTVLKAGYRPLGLVMGNCVYHVARQGLRGWLRTIGQNVEMTVYTEALYTSRELAMERMQKEAEALGAKMIIGANVHESNHSWGAHVVEFFAVGTAVEEISSNHVIEPPVMVLDLND